MTLLFMGQAVAPDAERVHSHGVDVTAADLEGLASLPRLVALSLNTTHTTDAMLPLIGRLVGLVDLDLSLTDITDDGMPHLRPLVRLKHLRLKENGGLTDRGVAHLEAFGDLETVNLKSLRIGDPTLEMLGGLHKLELIVFSRLVVSDAALERLARRLPRCEIIVQSRLPAQSS